MIIHPDFLQKSLGHFYRQRENGWVKKSKVGFLQTPQDFYKYVNCRWLLIYPLDILNRICYSPAITLILVQYPTKRPCRTRSSPILRTSSLRPRWLRCRPLLRHRRRFLSRLLGVHRRSVVRQHYRRLQHDNDIFWCWFCLHVFER